MDRLFGSPCQIQALSEHLSFILSPYNRLMSEFQHLFYLCSSLLFLLGKYKIEDIDTY